MGGKRALAALLALALGPVAFAGGTAGDLILGFRDDGSDGGTTGTNVTVDLGSFTNYTAGGLYYDPGVAQSIFNVTNSLRGEYGAGFLTDTGLYFGIVGTNGTASNQDALFVSAKATGGSPGTPNSTAWTVQSATTQNTQALKFLTLEVVNLPFSGGVPGVSDTSTLSATSWSSKENNSGGLSFGAFTTSAFEAISPGGSAMDLYALDPQSTGPGVGNPGVFLGTFSISSSGLLSFTATEIPEPPAAAILLAAAALAAVFAGRARLRRAAGA